MRDAVARVLERAAASRPSLAIGFLVESGRLRSGWATAFFPATGATDLPWARCRIADRAGRGVAIRRDSAWDGLSER